MAHSIYLLDGTYELFRHYYGVPKYQNSAGREVGAVRGLLRSCLALLKESEAPYLGCAFDSVITSFRNELFAGYKDGTGVEEALLGQFPLAEEALAALGVVVWPMVEFEADDAMATAAALYAQEPDVAQVLLCSPDKDLAQCVIGDRIVCFDRRRKVIYNAAGVVEKFGVAPASIPDWLALVGDTADGIPGVPRWGAKSASAMLFQYHHFEHIPADPADWEIKVRGAVSLSKELEAHREQVPLYRTLATLRTDVPIRESVQDLRWKGPDEAALARVCETLSAPKLLTEALKLAR